MVWDKQDFLISLCQNMNSSKQRMKLMMSVLGKKSHTCMHIQGVFEQVNPGRDLYVLYD